MKLRKLLVRRLRRAWVFLLILPAVSTLLATGAYLFDALELRAFEWSLYDRRLRDFAPPVERSENVVVAMLDERTVREIPRHEQLRLSYGNWPYSRLFWAHLVDELADRGARAVVLSFELSEPALDPTGDAALGLMLRDHDIPFYTGFTSSASAPPLPEVEAINRFDPTPALDLITGNVEREVGGGEGPSEGRAGPGEAKPTHAAARALAFPVVAAPGLELAPLPRSLTGTAEAAEASPVLPIPAVLHTASGFGVMSPETDPDGKMRRTRFAYTDGRNAYVTLPIAVAADLLGARSLTLEPGSLTLGERTLRIDLDGRALTPYGGPFEDAFEQVSVFDLLVERLGRNGGSRPAPGGATRIDPDLVRGKVVVVGGVRVGTGGIHPTPFSPVAPTAAKLGSEIEALLTGGFTVQASLGAAVVLGFVLALLATAGVLAARSPWVELSMPLLSGALAFVLTGLYLVHASVLVHASIAGVAPVLAAVGAIVINHLMANREREQVKRQLGRFVSPAVARELESEQVDLSGQDMMVTALFSDIRGFSSVSERYRDDPRTLVTILNTYLSRVTGVLQAHGACIDKYVGDAVVCLFGAPVRREDHALQACRAAMAMRAEVRRMREDFRRQGLPDVYTRIGVNSATMFVGILGSEQLFSYTAIGDGMNLAARLEAANKRYGTTLLIGQETRRQVGDALEVREVDRVRVEGKREPVVLYELLAERGALLPGVAELVEGYHRALALYRDARFAEAAEAFDALLVGNPDDGPSRVLRDRCRLYSEQPPEAPFDAVHDLDK